MTNKITLDEIRAWPATVSIQEASRVFGISKSHGYALAAAGQFPCRVMKIGQRYVVPTPGIIAAITGDSVAAAS